jgi:hypothetical protein
MEDNELGFESESHFVGPTPVSDLLLLDIFKKMVNLSNFLPCPRQAVCCPQRGP